MTEGVSGKQPTSPPLQKCFSPSSTLWKVCSHGDQAQQRHGYSRTLWSHLKPPLQCFLLSLVLLPLSPSPLLPSFSKERVVLTSAINDHDTLTSSTTQRTRTHTCSLGNVNLQLNIISFLTRIAQKHTLLVFMLQLNVVCVAWGQFRPFEEGFTEVYLLFVPYINDPHRAFLHSERRDLYGCWTD